MSAVKVKGKVGQKFGGFLRNMGGYLLPTLHPRTAKEFNMPPLLRHNLTFPLVISTVPKRQCPRNASPITISLLQIPLENTRYLRIGTFQCPLPSHWRIIIRNETRSLP